MWQDNNRDVMIPSVIYCCASAMLQWTVMETRRGGGRGGDWTLHSFVITYRHVSFSCTLRVRRFVFQVTVCLNSLDSVTASFFSIFSHLNRHLWSNWERGNRSQKPLYGWCKPKQRGSRKQYVTLLTVQWLITAAPADSSPCIWTNGEIRCFTVV